MNTIFYLLALLAPHELPAPETTVIVVVGAEGTSEYGQQFETWAQRWQSAAEKGKANSHQIGLTQPTALSDKQRLKETISQEASRNQSPLWIVLIGHGTFDGKTAKFNLRGSDVSATELNHWLEPATRPIVLINCASCSGPYLEKLAQPNRIVVTATQNGHEQNFARFGDAMSAAISETTADIDKDGQTSLLEAFLFASRKTQEFYKSESRLSTEHAIFDDNGDARGTRSQDFIGIRPIPKSARQGRTLDGLKARQFHLVLSNREQQIPAAIRQKRDQIELKVLQLREQKSEHSADEYFQKLEELLLKLANIYRQVDETYQATEKLTEKPRALSR